MKRIASTTLACLALLGLSAGTAQASPSAAYVVAKITIERTHDCPRILEGVELVGYQAAESYFAANYTATWPPVGKVFHAIAVICERRVG